MSFPKTTEFYHASVIRGMSKKGREYFAIQAKEYPDEDGYGDTFFFDYMFQERMDELVKSPFNQDSIIEVQITSSKRLLKVTKVIRPGRYPAEVRDLEAIFNKAKQAKDGKAPETPESTPNVRRVPSK